MKIHRSFRKTLSLLLKVQFFKAHFVAHTTCQHLNVKYHLVEKERGKHSGKVADFVTQIVPKLVYALKKSSVENVLIFINCSVGFQYKRNLRGERLINNPWYVPVHHFPICVKIGGIPYTIIAYILACNSKVHWKFLLAMIFSELSSSLP